MGEEDKTSIWTVWWKCQGATKVIHWPLHSFLIEKKRHRVWIILVFSKYGQMYMSSQKMWERKLFRWCHRPESIWQDQKSTIKVILNHFKVNVICSFNKFKGFCERYSSWVPIMTKSWKKTRYYIHLNIQNQEFL